MELAKEASQKYDVNITASQFLEIDKHIGKFICSLEVFDNEGFVKIMGSALVIANPIAVFFKLPLPIQKYVDILRNESNL